MTELSSDLKNMLNEMSKLRKTFLELKTTNVALVKLSEKQKQQLAKSRKHCKQLMELFTEKYKNIMENSVGLKSEISHLRQVVNDLQPEVENQALELKNKDELLIKLQDDLEILRSQIDFQADQHNKDIEIIQERNRIEKNREVSQLKKKLDAANAEIEKLKERLEQLKELQKSNQKKDFKRSSHPALSDGENSSNKGKTPNKRTKKQDSRWPNLNITTSCKTETSPKTAEQTAKKKKLFSLDNEKIVDLESLRFK